MQSLTCQSSDHTHTHPLQSLVNHQTTHTHTHCSLLSIIRPHTHTPTAVTCKLGLEWLHEDWRFVLTHCKLFSERLRADAVDHAVADLHSTHTAISTAATWYAALHASVYHIGVHSCRLNSTLHTDNEDPSHQHRQSVLQHCARSIACDGLSLSTPCWHWSEHWSSPTGISVTRSLWVPLYTCRTYCSPCWMPPLGLSTRAGRQNTQPHCYGSFHGYASHNESSSCCVFWHTVGTWHSTGVPVWQSAADIDVSALLTPRHYKCRRLVGLPLATAPFRWLQHVNRTVCH